MAAVAATGRGCDGERRGCDGETRAGGGGGGGDGERLRRGEEGWQLAAVAAAATGSRPGAHG